MSAAPPRLPFCLLFHSSLPSDTPGESQQYLSNLLPASSLGHGRGPCPPFLSDGNPSAAGTAHGSFGGLLAIPRGMDTQLRPGGLYELLNFP